MYGILVALVLLVEDVSSFSKYTVDELLLTVCDIRKSTMTVLPSRFFLLFLLIRIGLCTIPLFFCPVVASVMDEGRL